MNLKQSNKGERSSDTALGLLLSFYFDAVLNLKYIFFQSEISKESGMGRIT
jgi:hypothetical protein